MKITNKTKIIIALLLAWVLYIGLWNVGAEKRSIINALEYRGFKESADGLYRIRELNNSEDGLIMIERSFDIKANHGESRIVKLYQRADGQLIRESESIELGCWDYNQHHFNPIDWGR